MKGVIFTIFLEMVEEQFGYETVDSIIIKSDVPSKGIYTAVGTYPHEEIVALIVALSDQTEIPVPDLLSAYGDFLFTYFTKNYTAFFDRASDSFAFLESVDDYIHIEVQKLYPDATLPKLSTSVDPEDDSVMLMRYESDRKMGALAESLIRNAIDYYEEEAEITSHLLDTEGRQIEFLIRKKLENRDN